MGLWQGAGKLVLGVPIWLGVAVSLFYCVAAVTPKSTS
jgi:hypothetical protein